MAFTYDLSLGKSTTGFKVSRIRLYIGDHTQNEGVRPGGDNLTDDEIELLLDEEGSVLYAAAEACDMLSTEYATVADLQIDGDLKRSYNQISSKLERRAERLRAKADAGDTGVDGAVAVLMERDRG